MLRQVTHFFVGHKDQQCWVPTYFITADQDGTFYFGFGEIPIPADDVDRRIKLGEVEKLNMPLTIVEEQGLWITPSGSIWLASKLSPLGDHSKKLAKEMPLSFLVPKLEMLYRRNAGRTELWYAPDDFVGKKIYAEFADCVADSIAKQCDAIVRRTPMRGWDSLPNALAADMIDFCGLPYNLHTSRADRYEVVEFGIQDTYTLYFAMKATNFKGIGLPLFNDIHPPSERISGAIHDYPEIKFGVFLDTTAADEVISFFRTFPALAEQGRLETFIKFQDLKEWICGSPETNVVICDHSIAEKLDELKAPTLQFSTPGDLSFEHSTPRSILKYVKPLPVGFVYKRVDQTWRQVVRESTRVAIRQILIPNYDSFCEALKPLCIKVLSKQELAQRFNITDELNRGQVG